MSTTNQSKYGTNGQAITCTVASLGNTSARVATAIDNTSNLFLDALVFLKVKTGASGVASTGQINVYAIGTVDGGTTYTENAGSSDAAVTLTSPPGLPAPHAGHKKVLTVSCRPDCFQREAPRRERRRAVSLGGR